MGTLPYTSDSPAEMARMINQGGYKIADRITIETRSIITGCLERDPERRISVLDMPGAFLDTKPNAPNSM
jgi:serine/threonine protein kinase